MTEYPIERELDGVYFRISRYEKWCNICFSDLTYEERLNVIQGKNLEWMQRLTFRLADVLREIGNEFDICKQ